MVLNLFCIYLSKKANKIKNSSQTNYKDINQNETQKEKKREFMWRQKFPRRHLDSGYIVNSQQLNNTI